MDNVHFRLNDYAIFRNSYAKWWQPVETDSFVQGSKLDKLHPVASMKEAFSSAGPYTL